MQCSDCGIDDATYEKLYDDVAALKAKLATLRAEQEEFRKDRKEFGERYDEMTHKYELKVQQLRAENEELNKLLELSATMSNRANTQIKSQLVEIEQLRADAEVMAGFIDRGCPTLEGVDRIRTISRKYVKGE